MANYHVSTGATPRALILCIVAFLIPAASSAQDRTGRLRQLFSDYYEFHLRQSPEAATSAGRKEYNDRWSDPSPQAIELQRRELETFRKRLAEFQSDPLNQ